MVDARDSLAGGPGVRADRAVLLDVIAGGYGDVQAGRRDLFEADVQAADRQ